MKSARLPFRLFNRLRKQDGGFQRVDQGSSALNIRSQISDSNLFGNNFTANQQGSLSAQRNFYQSVDVTQGGSLFKVNEGGMLNVSNSYAGVRGQGLVVGHLNLPISSGRFRRACRAFVNAWRIG